MIDSVVDSDPSAVLVAFLLSQDALTAVAANRIYGETATPPSGYTPAAGPCVCLMVRGGTDDYSDVVQYPSLQFKCYGGGNDRWAQIESATATARALHGVLHNALTGRFYARREQLPVTLQEQGTGWPFALTFYKLMLHQGG